MNQLATKETTALSTQEGFGMECGDVNDRRIPHMMLAQGSVDYIQQGKARPGDIVDSESKTPLVDFGKELELIPFFLVKFWRIDKQVGGEWKKEETFLWEPKHKNNGWKETKDEFIGPDNEKRQRYLNYMLSCLLTQDGLTAPYVVTLKKGSLFAGKYISGEVSQGMGTKTYKLSAKSAINPVNNKPYFKFELSKGRPTTKDEFDTALEFHKIARASAGKIQDLTESE